MGWTTEGFWFDIKQGQWIFFLPKNNCTSFCDHPASWSSGALTPWMKWTECEADH